MTLRLAIVGFLALSAFSQQSALVAVIGSVKKVAGREIQVQAGSQSVTLYAGSKTVVWRGRPYHDLSPLRIGDEISARCERDASGKLMAADIWADMLKFSAVVTKVNPTSIEVLASVDEGAKSAGPRRSLTVSFYPETLFSTRPRDLTVGAQIYVVGLSLGNGNIDAARITLYNTDLPARG